MIDRQSWGCIAKLVDLVRQLFQAGFTDVSYQPIRLEARSREPDRQIKCL
jgi:hypothetical protein